MVQKEDSFASHSTSTYSETQVSSQSSEVRRPVCVPPTAP